MKKPQHLIIISALSLLALAFLGAYIYSFLKVKDFRSGTENLETEIQANTDLLAKSNEKTITEKIKEDQKNISKLETYFIKEGEEYVLIQTLETICGGIHISCDIKPLGIVNETGGSAQFHNIQVAISTEGTFKQTYQLLSVLENLPYRSKISNVQLDVLNPPIVAPIIESNASTTSTTTPPIITKRVPTWKGSIDMAVTTSQ